MADRASSTIARALVAVLAASCAACAAISDPAAFAVVSQDKYDFLPCKDILSARGNLINAEKKLTESAEKAEASPGGIIVSYTAYRSELANVRGLAAAATRAAQKNGCTLPK